MDGYERFPARQVSLSLARAARLYAITVIQGIGIGGGRGRARRRGRPPRMAMSPIGS